MTLMRALAPWASPLQLQLMWLLLLLLLLLLLTLTQQPSHAATPTPSPDFDEPEKEQSAKSIEEQMKIESLDIGRPPVGADKPQYLEAPYYHSYHRALSFRSGYLLDLISRESTDPVYLIFGAVFQFTTIDLNIYEAGADLLSNYSGRIHFSRVFLFSRTRMRPFAKLGVGLRVFPSDQLLIFAKYTNYQARAAGGVEYLVAERVSLRTEAELALAKSGFETYLAVGVSMGF